MSLFLPMQRPVYNNHTAQSRGFATIEILLVVGVLVMMLAVSASVVSKTQVSAQLVDAKDTLAQQLRAVRASSRALEGGTAHGVYVSSSAIISYRGDSYDERDAQYDRIIPFQNITLAGLLFTATTSDTNIALSQPASASSQFNASYPPSRANDGSDSTFWFTSAGGSNGGWWQVDLGAVETIAEAQIRWYNTSGTYNCTDFRIQGSNNPSVFTDTLWSGNSVGQQEQTYIFSSPGSYQYWRMLCQTANNGSYYVLNEVRLYPQIILEGDPDFNFIAGAGTPVNTGTIQITHPVHGSETVTVTDIGSVE